MNYLIKVLQYTVSKPDFFYPCRDNPLPANWGVPRLMREERRAKRCETKRWGLTKNLERRLRESCVQIIRFVRFLSLCSENFSPSKRDLAENPRHFISGICIITTLWKWENKWKNKINSNSKHALVAHIVINFNCSLDRL